MINKGVNNLKPVLLQLTTGQWVVGKLSEADTETVTLQTPLIIELQPDPTSGGIKVMMIPFGFPIFIRDPKSVFSQTFYTSALIAPPNHDVPQNILALYTQETSSIQLASSLPTKM